MTLTARILRAWLREKRRRVAREEENRALAARVDVLERWRSDALGFVGSVPAGDDGPDEPSRAERRAHERRLQERRQQR